MADHRIRFRGGWEIIPESLDQGRGRLTLPIKWPIGIDGIGRLIRQFGRPPVVSIGVDYRIEFLRVPGLISARLNHVEIGPPTGQFSEFQSLTVNLLDRNTLELDLDLDVAASSICAEGWGAIALVIESTELQDRDESSSDCPSPD